MKRNRQGRAVSRTIPIVWTEHAWGVPLRVALAATARSQSLARTGRSAIIPSPGGEGQGEGEPFGSAEAFPTPRPRVGTLRALERRIHPAEAFATPEALENFQAQLPGGAGCRLKSAFPGSWKVSATVKFRAGRGLPPGLFVLWRMCPSVAATGLFSLSGGPLSMFC